MTQSNKLDPIAGAIRQGLQEHGNGSQGCPAPDVLGSYFERSLEAGERVRWETHFSRCLRCQEQLATLARMETVLGSAQRVAPQAGSWFLNWRWLTGAGAAALGALVIWVALQSPGGHQEMLVRTVQEQKAQANEVAKLDAAKPAQAPAATAVEPTRTRVPEAASAAPPPASAPPRTDQALDTLARANTATQSSGSLPAERDQVAGKEGLAVSASGEKGRAALRESDVPQKRAEVLSADAVQDAKAAEEQKIQSGAVAKPQMAKQVPAVAAQVAPPVPADRQFRVDAPAAKKETVDQKDALRAQSTVVVTQEAPPRASEAPGYDTGRSVRGPLPMFSALAGRIHWRFFADGRIERYDERLKAGDMTSNPAAEKLLAASAPSEKVCWAVGQKGIVIRTVDKQAWQQIGSPTEEDLVFVEAQDALRATVRTRNNKSYVTSDGGRTWSTP